MESWRSKKTLILSRTDIMGLVTPAEYVACVEQAYRMHGEGRFSMEPKGHIVLDKYPGEWEAMPSYIEEPEAAACKWVSIRENNRAKYDLPTVFSILIYTDPETGFPLAICDGSYHTVQRTGASAAVSAKWMARPDSKVLAIVGGGNMAEGALETCDTVFEWDEVRVWSRSESTLDHFRSVMEPKIDGRYPIVTSTDVESTVRGADVVVTITSSFAPILKAAQVRPGTHVACMGTDTRGKQEVEAELLAAATVFTDEVAQSVSLGEAQHAVARGLLAADSIVEIGAVINGDHPGRVSDAEITVFDGTGVGLQDLAVAAVAVDRAVAKGLATEVDF